MPNSARRGSPENAASENAKFRSVLPALVHEFEAVAVRVQNIGGVVARVVIESRAGCAVVRGSGSDGGSIGGVDFSLAVRHKTDVSGATVRRTLPEPEEDASIGPKPLQVGMTRRPVFAVVVD